MRPFTRGYKLRPMSRFGGLLLLGVFLSPTACDRRAPAAGSTEGPSRGENSAPVPDYSRTGWPEDAGPLIGVPALTFGRDIDIVLPGIADDTFSDTATFVLDSLPGGRIDLFNRNGKVATTTIAGGAPDVTPGGCRSWPKALLSNSITDSSWTVGLQSGVASGVRVTTPASASDSTEAANTIGRIMAAAPNTDPTFHDLPISVRAVYRFVIGADSYLLADAIRRINTEANVREEHNLILASKGSDDNAFTLAYSDRQIGTEERVAIPDLLTVVLLGENRRPALLLDYESAGRSRLVLLQRNEQGRWTSRWRSASTGCSD
jgi:hypothetical protein